MFSSTNLKSVDAKFNIILNTHAKSFDKSCVKQRIFTAERTVVNVKYWGETLDRIINNTGHSKTVQHSPVITHSCSIKFWNRQCFTHFTADGEKHWMEITNENYFSRKINIYKKTQICDSFLEPLLLTWNNFNLSMDKQLYPLHS